MKHILVRWARVVATIASAILIVSYVSNHYSEITIINPIYLFGSLFLSCIIIPLIVNNRWKFFLSLHGVDEPIIVLAKINFVSIFYGLALPSSNGHDLIKVLMIEKKHPNKRGMVGSSVVLERFMGLSTLCVVASIATLSIPENVVETNLRYYTIVMSLIILSILLLMTSKSSYRIMLHLLYQRPVKQRAAKSSLEYIRLVHQSLSDTANLAVYLKSFVLVLILQLATIFNVYLVFMSIGVSIPLVMHLAIMPVVYIISMIPITISGIGLREGVFALMYGKIGVDAPLAVVASLLNYFLLIIIPALIGMTIVLVTKLIIYRQKSGKWLTERH